MAEHIQSRDGARVPVTELYAEYIEAAAAEDAIQQPSNICWFAKTTCQLFGCATIRKRDNKGVYTGKHFDNTCRAANNNITTLNAIPKYIADIADTYPDIHTTFTEDTVTIYLNTDITLNSNPVVKNVIFQKDGKWEIVVGTTSVDLGRLGICSTVTWTESFVAATIHIATRLQVCHGATATGDVTLRTMVREEVRTADGRCTAVVRPRTCHRVVPFGAWCSWPTCRSCQNVKTSQPKRASKDTVDLNPTLAGDMEAIIEIILPNASPQMKALIVEQRRQLSAKGPCGHRWSKELITKCLSLWIRSPQGYQYLLDTGLVILPSRSTLKLYKNDVEQGSGFHDKVFHWMLCEARRRNLPANGFHGGIVMDEMTIGEDLQAVRSGNYMRLIGFVDQGDESENLHKITKQSGDRELANHVLLMQFVGFTGFRFPIAHFATRQATAADMFINFWKAVSMLQAYGFHADYTNIDGAITNRQFVKMHFAPNQTPASNNFQIVSPVNPTEFIFVVMDIKHTIKKIRNNILSSGPSGTRLLKIDGHMVVWAQWQDAYQWDRRNPLQVHHRLTHEHVYLDSASKMRNRLAEDVLDANMLQLFFERAESMGSGGASLSGCIALLEQTSRLIAIFHDTRPISVPSDDRLAQLITIGRWFKDWETTTMAETSLSGKAKRAMLLSPETREDTESSILGFVSLVEHRYGTYIIYNTISICMCQCLRLCKYL